MKAACLVVRSLAPSTEGVPPSGMLGDHVSRCLRCQAELARYSRLRRHLGALADEVEPAPPPLATDVDREVGSGSDDTTPPRRVPQVGRVAATGGAVAAAAAGAAAVIVWRHSKAAV
ncbi:MAG: hypothetical protein QNJ89_14830 [Acidimicrobiia bacterium]|nr:hypothetical protein [Acidimicrobiia bacterium]